MTITNLQLVNIWNILNVNGNKKLPQKISYAITKNLMKVSKDYECYEKSLQKIYEIYKDDVILDEDGKPKFNQNGIPLVDENISEQYFGEINDLLSIEIDVDLHQIPFEVFDYDNGDRYDALSALDIVNLQSVLCEDKSDTKTEGE